MTPPKQDTVASPPTSDAQPLNRQTAVYLAGALRKHLFFHQQMGIGNYGQSEVLDRFLRPQRQPAVKSSPRVPGQRPALARVREPVKKPVAAIGQSAEPVAAVMEEVQACAGCDLAAGALRVPGQGKKGARLLIVGDYPQSAAQGAALFGQAEDELLWKMMQAIGLHPGDVYVTNVVKCRPGEDASPSGASEQACRGYLYREIAAVQPRVILAMGAMAARTVLGTEVSLFRLRGRLHATRFVDALGAPIPVMVSFHPRFLLEQPKMKKASWQDLQIVQRQLLSSMKGNKAGG